MKIALACDHLVARDYSVEIIERLCEIFPKAPIYTFAFQEGNVLGEIEHRRIHASHLSHKLKNLQDIEKYKFLFPSIAGKICQEGDFDVLLSVSSGFAHGIKVPEGKKHISYIWNENTKYAKPNLVTKFFGKYLTNWQKKKREELDDAFYASKTFEFEGEKKIIYPPVVLDDFPKAYDSKADQVLINTSYANEEKIHQVLNICKEHDLKYHCLDVGHEQKDWKQIGVDSEKVSHSTCPSDLKKHFEQSFAFLDLSPGVFNPELIIALALGRPLVVYKHKLFEEYFTNETAIFISESESQSLGQKLLELRDHQDAFFPSILQKKTFLFHPTKFKNTFKKEIEKYVH